MSASTLETLQILYGTHPFSRDDQCYIKPPTATAIGVAAETTMETWHHPASGLIYPANAFLKYGSRRGSCVDWMGSTMYKEWVETRAAANNAGRAVR